MAKKGRKSITQPENQYLPPSKEEKLFQNLLKVTSQLVQGKNYSPLTFTELFVRLSLPSQHKDVLKDIISELVKEGLVKLSKGRYHPNKPKLETVPGTLRVHPKGFGFLQPNDTVKYPQDVFIPKHLTLNAVDGDAVEIIITDISSEKGPEGRVTAILQRGRTHMGGIIKKIEHGSIYAHVPLLGPSQVVEVTPPNNMKLVVGDRVVMEVVQWGNKEENAICKVSHYIGHISDPTCDIPAAVEEYEIRSDFSSKVIEEAKKIGNKVTAKDMKDRDDLRSIECFTIDPDTAKDFDDALSLSKDAKGHYHLGVHIADVSHYVRPGTHLDDEAKERCNSTYFPGKCIPMLPSELSDNLCSLKPDVNRLTVTVWMQFNTEGNLVDYRITRSVINSAKRFTYREAKEILDGHKKSVHEDTLRLMLELCRLLKKKRYERGSIEFALPDLAVIVDDKGVPLRTDYIAYDETHQLVEEFMLKANEMVATHLSNHGKNLTYRIHDVPSEENMKDFSLLASAFGFNLSEKPTSRELQNLFDEALGTTYGPYLATSYIRRMRLAVYSPDNIGHYGLGLTHYCHFTSPIRRYVDLVSHRILFGESDIREELERVSDKCSEQERISAKAESSVVQLKKLRLLKSYYDKDPRKQYLAVVTRIKNFGYFFEVVDFMIEGFLHVSELEDDYYIYDENQMRLRGRHRGQTYHSGDKVWVMLKSVDFISQESKWMLVGKEDSDEELLNEFVNRPKQSHTPPSKFVKQKAIGWREGRSEKSSKAKFSQPKRTPLKPQPKAKPAEVKEEKSKVVNKTKPKKLTEKTVETKAKPKAKKETKEIKPVKKAPPKPKAPVSKKTEPKAPVSKKPKPKATKKTTTKTIAPKATTAKKVTKPTKKKKES